MCTKKTTVFLIAILSLVNAKAQSNSKKDYISYIGNAWQKEVFVYHGVEVTKPVEIYKKLSTNDDSKNYFKKANTNKKLSKICSAIGGLCLGVGVIDIASGKSFNSTLFVAGAGLTLISLPLTTKYFKNMKKSVSNYNKEYR